MSKTEQMSTATSLHHDRPTPLSFAALRTWVIWQFPRLKGDWHCGAVHPPAAKHGWYPAAINPDTERIRVHAHHDRRFPTPEAAADWMEKTKS